jgi:PAS domain S-box-containing protein
MSALSSWLFDPSGLTPHGFCLLWEPWLIWTYAAADVLIGISYLTIPIALGVIARKRHDLMFRSVFLLFGVFITLCGLSHFLDVLTLWVPAYGLEALIKSGTAITSAITAAVLWRLLPDVLTLPSHGQMRAQEQALKHAMTEAADRQQLLDMVNVAAVLLRDLDGTIQFWSEGCYRLYGWTAEQAIGRSSHELLQTVFPGSLADLNATLLRNGSWNGELHHRTRDGAEIIVSASMVLHQYADGHDGIVMVNVTDITALRQTETKLHSREAQFGSLVDTAIDGFVIAHSDGQIQWVNRAILSLFGYERAEELIGRNLRVLMPVAEATRHDGYLAAHHAGARPRVIGVPGRELLAVRCDGSEFPIDLSVSSFSNNGALHFTGIIRDATTRKKAEMALRESEARFHGIFDSQFQLIELLRLDGTILEVNRASLDAGGLTRSEVIGQPFWQIGRWPGAERDRVHGEIAQAARGTTIHREVEINGAAGRTIWVDFSLKPVRDPVTDEVTSIIAEGRDLTEKRNLTNQLAQAQKLQALGQLAGGIAHDFNNILQAVSGAAMLIEQRPGDHDRVRRLASTMIAAANRGTSITQRLLSFARRGELRAAPIATSDLLNSMREVFAYTLGTTIAVCTSVPPSVPALIADQPQLETAIINLGTNARDAMPGGGTIILSAEAENVAEGHHHPAGLAPGDYVRLSFADNGTGMDAATLARVSEPFFTTKPQGQGTGLGLAMVKGFTEQSGGGLSITSTPGQGTTVTMWLHQATTDVVRTGGDDDQHGVPIGLQLSARILLVDDDDLIRETLAELLEEAGFTTLVAASGLEALALVESGEVVDAMVSDLSMPGMNGVTIIRKARALRPGLPCFLLTGYVGERAALSTENTFTLVRKPVTIRALVALIEATLEGAKRQKPSPVTHHGAASAAP